MEQKKLPNREQIRTNIRIDEETYNRLLNLKLKTKYSLNTLMKIAFEKYINLHQD